MWELLLSVVMALSATVNEPPRLEPPSSLADLPRGEPPRVGYVDHGTWHGPSDRRVELPDRHGIFAVAPYDGGFLIYDQRVFEGSVGLSRIDANGDRLGSWTSSGWPAVDADGSVAWTSFTPLESGLSRPSRVHIGLPDGCVRTIPREGLIPFSVAGFVGEDVVVNGASSEARVTILDTFGSDRPVPRLNYAEDAHDPWIVGNLGRGTGLVDLNTGEVQWRTRAWDLTFSPSGRRVAGFDRDGVNVFRSTDGRLLWQVDEPLRFYAEAGLVWEDERHLLSVVTRRREIAILRFGRGDEVERATPVSRFEPFRPPYVLATKP